MRYGNPQVEMRFRWCPAGTFKRGSEKGRSNEKPVLEVTISKGLWIAETPCTQAQWRAGMPTNPAPSYFKGDNLPVEKVSALDADAFCAALAKLTGEPIRLPTEAEWEYSCRAGTTTDYHTGDGEEALKKAGWYGGNSGGKSHPVGELAANAWGLKDMHGNVWEWCSDWYGEYKKDKTINPTGPASGTFRVRRGGDWFYDSGDCRAAYRYAGAPSHRNHDLGLRLARVSSVQ